MESVFMRETKESDSPFSGQPLPKTHYHPSQPISRAVSQQTQSKAGSRLPPSQASTLTVYSGSGSAVTPSHPLSSTFTPSQLSTSGGSSRFNESWPNTSDLSPPHTLTVGEEKVEEEGEGEGEGECEKEPTIASYVRRFRQAPPKRRGERERPNEPFWWSGPPYPPHHSTPNSSQEKTVSLSASMRVSSLEEGEGLDERTQMLIDKSSSLLSVSSVNSPPAQKYLNSGRLGLPPPPPLSPTTHPALPLPEEDILYQWRLRRRLEQARREAATTSQPAGECSQARAGPNPPPPPPLQFSGPASVPDFPLPSSSPLTHSHSATRWTSPFHVNPSPPPPSGHPPVPFPLPTAHLVPPQPCLGVRVLQECMPTETCGEVGQSNLDRKMFTACSVGERSAVDGGAVEEETAMLENAIGPHTNQSVLGVNSGQQSGVRGKAYSEEGVEGSKEIPRAENKGQIDQELIERDRRLGVQTKVPRDNQASVDPLQTPNERVQASPVAPPLCGCGGDVRYPSPDGPVCPQSRLSPHSFSYSSEPDHSLTFLPTLSRGNGEQTSSGPKHMVSRVVGQRLFQSSSASLSASLHAPLPQSLGFAETKGVLTTCTAQRWDEDLDDELLRLLIARAIGFEARLREIDMLLEVTGEA